MRAPDASPAWRRLPELPNYMSDVANGPLWGRDLGETLELGFKVEKRHCNPRDVCHGGMLLTFADMVLGFGVNWQKPDVGFLPTISLGGDFLAPAPLGAWVAGAAQVLRITRNLAFAQGVVTADGTPCLRWNGTAKIQTGERTFRIHDWLRA